MLNKLKEVESRFEEINSQLYDPSVVCDAEKYSTLMKEFKNLTPIVEKYREYKLAQEAFEEAKELLYESGLDKDFREMVQLEYDEGKKKTEELFEQLKIKFSLRCKWILNIAIQVHGQQTAAVIWTQRNLATRVSTYGLIAEVSIAIWN